MGHRDLLAVHSQGHPLNLTPRDGGQEEPWNQSVFVRVECPTVQTDNLSSSNSDYFPFAFLHSTPSHSRAGACALFLRIDASFRRLDQNTRRQRR